MGLFQHFEGLRRIFDAAGKSATIIQNVWNHSLKTQCHIPPRPRQHTCEDVLSLNLIYLVYTTEPE